jgi:hypothetical protein
MSKETYSKMAKEVLVPTLNLRKLSVMYSVNFMVLQRVFKGLNIGSGKKFYVKVFYNSFQKLEFAYIISGFNPCGRRSWPELNGDQLIETDSPPKMRGCMCYNDNRKRISYRSS